MVMSEKKYALYAVWFYYNDEWSATNGELADFQGEFDSLKEAKVAHRKAELKAVRHMIKLGGKHHSYWHGDAANSEGFNVDANDEEMWGWMQKHEVYFHRIVQHKGVVKHSFIEFEPEFWGEKITNYFKDEGIYLRKPETDSEKANISQQQAIDLTIHYLKRFPEGHFLANTYFEDLSLSSILLLNYLRGCKSVELISQLVTVENLREVNTSLQKLNSQRRLIPGHFFYILPIPDKQPIDYFEMKGLLPLLKIQPFKLVDTYVSVNGEKVKKESEHGGESLVHY